MSLVPYDDQAVDQIAANLNLRAPNRDALDAIAQQLDTRPEGSELVADLATGVGKTYIAGGLLDYLFEQGVRNVVIVVPGKTLLRKTVNNLTPGNPKYLQGLASDPLVITINDFERGTVGAALNDPDRFKVFIFTVQSLLKPNLKDNRRAHRPHETLGQSLSDYLRGTDDLVVIADEHHFYFSETATKFKSAIRDLDPIALIGLTATPHEATNPDDIVYRYPLAAAIADGYVKIPVLVARQDGTSDLRTQLADGLQLLAAKESALRAYTTNTHQPYIQPLLFVVASTIDEATTIRDILTHRDYLNGDDKVLLVTSQEPDIVTDQLDTLENPNSPIQAVVSVQMLGIGWDIKNVYVIAAVRALESDLLTEQILGRGLRLPFGRRTGIPMLDTVEVLSHHAFADLLKNARSLLQATLSDRADQATAIDTSQPGLGSDPINLDQPHTPTGPDASITISLPGPPAPDTNPNQADLLIDLDPTDTESDTTGHNVLGIATIDARLDDGTTTTEALTTSITPHPPTGTHLPLYIPKVTYTWYREPFSLASINTLDVEALGAQFADDNAPTLKRKILDAHRDTHGTIDVQISDATDPITAALLPMPFNTIEDDLVTRILNANAVESSLAEYNAATKIAQAFLTGAHVTPDTPWRPEHGRLATITLTTWIAERQTATPPKLKATVTQERWPDPPEITETQQPVDRHLITRAADFLPNYPYTGWTKAFYTVATFHSYSGEFRLAELLDTTPGIKAWQRITTTVPLAIPYQIGATNRTYIPDFIVIDTNNIHWIVEGKADRDLTDPTVAAKRDATHTWIDTINTTGTITTRWAYLLAGETTIRNAPNWAALKAASHTHQ